MKRRKNNKIARKSRARNFQIKNFRRKSKQKHKKFLKALLAPLKVDFGKTVQKIIAKTPHKIIKHIDKQEVGEPEFNCGEKYNVSR